MFGWIKRYRETGKVLTVPSADGYTLVYGVNLRVVVPGQIYRGAAPDSYLEFLQIVRDLKIKTVLDLRLEQNRSGPGYDPREQDWCRDLGVRHISIPMSDKDPILATQFDNALEWLNLTDDAPFFVHCEGGRHRTGAVIAAYRVLRQGWTAKDAWEEAETCGYYDAWGHADVRKSWLKYVTDKLLEGTGR